MQPHGSPSRPWHPHCGGGDVTPAGPAIPTVQQDSCRLTFINPKQAPLTASSAGRQAAIQLQRQHEPLWLDVLVAGFMNDFHFRNFPKLSETFGDCSLDCIIFTDGFISVISFKVVLAHSWHFWSESLFKMMRPAKWSAKLSKSFGMFRKVTKTITLRQNGQCHIG